MVELDYDYENTHTVIIRRLKKIFSCVITQFDHSKLTWGEKEICVFVFLTDNPKLSLFADTVADIWFKAFERIK